MRVLFKLGSLGILLGALVLSCVTEFQPDRVSITPSLIVEGMITNQAGPYTVKLTRTSDYSYAALNLLETGATVTIADNQGNQEVLKEQTGGGVYKTSATGIQGVVGRAYTLTIKTKSGEQYVSDAEVLKAAPPIDRIYYEYEYDAGATDNGKANGWNIYIDTKDPETTGDYYRWVWTHYEFTDYCATNYVKNANYLMGLPCCSNCWNISKCYSNCINIMSDVAINGNNISRQFMERVPYDASTKYYVEIAQQSISPGVYAFFKTAQQQVLNTGGLFDSAPASIGGNIHPTGTTTLAAYGYFGAIGLSEGYIIVDRSHAKGSPVPTSEAVIINNLAACVACAQSQYRTPVQPRWWQW